MRYAIVLANYAKRDDNGVWTVSIGVRQLGREVDGKETEATKSAAKRALKALMDCNALYLISGSNVKGVTSVFAINTSLGADLHSEMHPKSGAKSDKKSPSLGADLHLEVNQSFKDLSDKDCKTENETSYSGKHCPDCGAVITVTANHETGMLTFICPICGELGCRPI